MPVLPGKGLTLTEWYAAFIARREATGEKNEPLCCVCKKREVSSGRARIGTAARKRGMCWTCYVKSGEAGRMQKEENRTEQWHRYLQGQPDY